MIVARTDCAIGGCDAILFVLGWGGFAREQSLLGVILQGESQFYGTCDRRGLH